MRRRQVIGVVLLAGAMASCAGEYEREQEAKRHTEMQEVNATLTKLLNRDVDLQRALGQVTDQTTRLVKVVERLQGQVDTLEQRLPRQEGGQH